METWSTRLRPLTVQVKKQLKGTKRLDVRPLQYRAVLEEMERQKDETKERIVKSAMESKPVEQSNELIPREARPLRRRIQQKIGEVDAATALKYFFVIQMGRVEEMLKAENPMSITRGVGIKNIEALRAIAEAICKLEIGERWMRDQYGEMP